MDEKSTTIEQRYGRKTSTASKKKFRIFAIGAIILGIAVVAWFSTFASKAPTVSDITGELGENHTVSVKFTVHNPTGKNIRCGVRALNTRYAVVGYKTLDIDAQEGQTHSYQVSLLTDSPAASADVEKCWTTS